MSKPVSLYIHVPFCSKLCPYCGFYKRKWDKDLEVAYVAAICEEIEGYSRTLTDRCIKTIFWGGGTPNILRRQSVDKIMRRLFRSFNVQDGAEITMEMNPTMSIIDKLLAFKESGINRVSLGVQSMSPTELETLGRNHSVADAHDAMNALKQVGFANLSVDIMFGFPGTNRSELRDTLDQILDHSPQHISAYGLSIEKGTPFFLNGVTPVDSDLFRSQYTLIRHRLGRSGYTQYEVSNYSLPGYESIHNMAYWDFSDYIGLGPGAHSFFDGRRYSHPRDLHRYMKSPIPREARGGINQVQPTLLFEYIMVQLRLRKGILISDINHRFNMDFLKRFDSQLKGLKAVGYIRVRRGRVQIAVKGLYVLDEIIQTFV